LLPSVICFKPNAVKEIYLLFGAGKFIRKKKTDVFTRHTETLLTEYGVDRSRIFIANNK